MGDIKVNMSSNPTEPMFPPERTRKVMLGELPIDFLRVGPLSQADTDQQLAMALDRQLNYTPRSCPTPNVGRLNITVDQAKLIKNYGIARMDPYVRLRVGHCVYETHTDSNGGKNPRWNKAIQCLLPLGIRTISVEIYDERSFTMDERIAWAEIFIPPSIFNGETHEEWFPLSGKQGEGLEGTINLILSFNSGPALYSFNPPPIMVPSNNAVLQCRDYPTTVAYSPTYYAPQAPQPKSISPEDVQMVVEMFPNLDKDVIKSVLQANNGDRDATINTLLQMS